MTTSHDIQGWVRNSVNHKNIWMKEVFLGSNDINHKDIQEANNEIFCINGFFLSFFVIVINRPLETK